MLFEAKIVNRRLRFDACACVWRLVSYDACALLALGGHRVDVPQPGNGSVASFPKNATTAAQAHTLAEPAACELESAGTPAEILV